MIAYELAAGKAAFSGDAYLRMALACCHPPPFEESDLHGLNLPGWLTTLIGVCTERNVKWRYSCMNVVAEVLHEHLYKLELVEGPVNKMPAWRRLAGKLLRLDSC